MFRLTSNTHSNSYFFLFMMLPNISKRFTLRSVKNVSNRKTKYPEEVSTLTHAGWTCILQVAHAHEVRSPLLFHLLTTDTWWWSEQMADTISQDNEGDLQAQVRCVSSTACLMASCMYFTHCTPCLLSVACRARSRQLAAVGRCNKGPTTTDSSITKDLTTISEMNGTTNLSVSVWES